jgi:hypothetical protein
VYVYSKLFNHLTQYALEQVDTDEKKYRFMNDLSTKLQERLALNADWTFLELVSNPLGKKEEEGIGNPLGQCSTSPPTTAAASLVGYLSTITSEYHA